MKRPSAKGNSAVWRLGLILLLSVALWPLSLRAEAPIGRFVIGVWSPAGWSGADRDSYDRFFTQSDADHLSELGVNLLVQTPRIGHRDRKDYRAVDPANREEADAHEIMQDLEEGIIGKFKTHGGLVIEQSAEEDLPEEDPARGEPTTYTSEFPIGDRLIDFAGVRGGINEYKVKQQVIALSNKWGGTDYVDGFFGYFIGHERYPRRSGVWRGGIYDSATYTNLSKVIDAIRRHDTTRAIVAVGNTSSTDAWSATEQEAFWRAFFRSAQDPGPANILMNEHYVFHCGTDTKAEVQEYLSKLTAQQGSLTRTRDMVTKARNDGRKAEWYHIINVNNEYRVGEFRDIDKDGDLEWIDNSCWSGTRSGSVANSPHLRRPSKAELSVQAYMALARGATGIVYYSHTTNGLAALTGYDDPTDPDDNTPQQRLPVWMNCPITIS